MKYPKRPPRLALQRRPLEEALGIKPKAQPPPVMEDEEAKLKAASRRLLFGNADEPAIPGAGTQADKSPKRHVRVKVTMNLDADIVEHFKEKAQSAGKPYQYLLNQVLREHIEGSTPERLAREVGGRLLEDRSFIERIAKLVK